MRGNRETEMMDVRWKVFKFHNRIPQHERKNNIPSPRYFGGLTFFGNFD